MRMRMRQTLHIELSTIRVAIRKSQRHWREEFIGIRVGGAAPEGGPVSAAQPPKSDIERPVNFGGQSQGDDRR